MKWYLFPNLLANANPASFNDLQTYLDARVAPARAQNRDRFFTFATSIAEENALINSGAERRIRYPPVLRYRKQSRVRRRGFRKRPTALPPGLIAAAKLPRSGTTSSNLQTVAGLNGGRWGRRRWSTRWVRATAGTARVLRFVQPDGATIESSITKTRLCARSAVGPVWRAGARRRGQAGRLS